MFKKILLSSLIAVSVTLANSTFAAPETFQLDPSHTYVLWEINHLGFSTQVGKWYIASGTLVIDKDKPANSKVDAEINIDTLSTGLGELDEHLKGENFLDVAKFPTATFKSDKVTVTGKKTAKVNGMLTLHGVSKPVVLNVTFNKEGVSPVSENYTMGFAATTNIKRSDFGIKTFLPVLGDEVKIQIGAEGFQKKK